jgi:hypothetical protein
VSSAARRQRARSVHRDREPTRAREEAPAVEPVPAGAACPARSRAALAGLRDGLRSSDGPGELVAAAVCS